MQELLVKFRISAEQLSAVTALESDSGKPYYEVESSKGDGSYYTLRYHRLYYTIQCNCAAGREGIPCWHVRAVTAYQERERMEQAAPDAREQAAIAQDGAQAYERRPFDLMAS